MTSTSVTDRRNAGEAEPIVPPLWRLVVGRTNPITPLNDVEAAPSFYCVHPIAGDVSSFYPLAHHLNTSVGFYGIQVSRDKMNARFGASIVEMARHYVGAVMAHQPEGPVYIGGWSAGAIVALEMAQQLLQAGRAVPLLVAFDGAPCNTGVAMKWWHPVFIFCLIKNIPLWIADESKQAGGLRGLLRSIHFKLIFRTKRACAAFKNDQTLDGDAVKKLVLSKAWTGAQMAFIQAFYNALRDYVPRCYDGKVLVIESRTQPLLAMRKVGAAWKKVAPSALIVQLKSNHEGIFREPFLSALADRLRDCICADSDAAALRVPPHSEGHM